jgi:NAD(P)-dependent dehydrogenase (short-subunit alcohol dehydrogenase family)
MAGELADKVAIVTGGASGIGRAAVEKFVAEGARVVIADVDDPAGTALAEALGSSGAFHHTDVTDAGQVQACVDLAVSSFGGLHVMVNNAGISSAMVRFLHDDFADFRRVMDVNVLGVMLGAQAAARHMKAHGGGAIINTSSIAGISGGAGLATYRASKAAVIHLSKSIAVDLAQYAIRVNCICPGHIETSMTAAYEMGPVVRMTQPLPRQGTPGDVAEALVYLASDRSAQLTGVVLPIDGGTTVGPPADQLKLLMAAAPKPG